MLLGVLVFLVTYLLIATRKHRFARLDRPAGAIVGAVLAVAVGAVTPESAMRAVDQTTIVLLFAVMGMGTFLSLDGFFERAGRIMIARARTRRRLIGILVWGSGLLASIVTNDAVCVLLAPLVVAWIQQYQLPRLPFLAALATAANTGSAATLVGNPQNILIGSLGNLQFTPFLLHLLPVALVGLAINHALILWVFRNELGGELPAEPAPPALMTVRSAITLAVIFGAVVIYMTGGNLAFTALGGFAVLLVVHRREPATVWERIDWSVLVFFGALFIAVDALARSGAAQWAFSHFPLVGDGAGATDWLRASGIFLVGSNVVTNVPFIMIVRPEMAGLPDPALGWELLAMATTFAGNLTLLGSVANVIVAEKAQAVGGLRFGEYLRIGVPVALATTLAGSLILIAIHL